MNYDVVNLCWANTNAFNSLNMQRSNGNGKTQKTQLILLARTEQDDKSQTWNYNSTWGM